MDWTLEVVVIPVTDVDRSKRFYSEQLGFNVDVDTNVGDMRVVQLTPPGSGCSVTVGPLVVDEIPKDSARLQVCVTDIEAARAQLLERGVEVGEVTHFAGGGPYDSFVFFQDPDGNNWAVQEVPATRPFSGVSSARLGACLIDGSSDASDASTTSSAPKTATVVRAEKAPSITPAVSGPSGAPQSAIVLATLFTRPVSRSGVTAIRYPITTAFTVGKKIAIGTAQASRT